MLTKEENERVLTLRVQLMGALSSVQLMVDSYKAVIDHHSKMQAHLRAVVAELKGMKDPLLAFGNLDIEGTASGGVNVQITKQCHGFREVDWQTGLTTKVTIEGVTEEIQTGAEPEPLQIGVKVDGVWFVRAHGDEAAALQARHEKGMNEREPTVDMFTERCEQLVEATSEVKRVGAKRSYREDCRRREEAAAAAEESETTKD